jgi:hypothetical protein
MKPMRANHTSKWQLSVADRFALLRERDLETDTIPKPVGLGIGTAQGVRSVRLMSGLCPRFVRSLSGAC